MSYFVTGGTGFLGGHVVDQLLAAGHEVTAIVRDPSRAHDLAAKGVELRTGDLRDRESMCEGMSGTDGVFHIAAWYHVGEDDDGIAEAINVGGTRNVLELARELEIPRVVYTSTLAVYGDTAGRVVTESDRPTGPVASTYEGSKRRAQLQVVEPMIAAGAPVVIVSPGVIYGPGDREGPVAQSTRLWLSGKLPALPRGTTYCWAHVEDVARGHIQAMLEGELGETYFLAGPPHTLQEAFEVAAPIAGRAAPFIPLPGAVLRVSAALFSPLARVVTLPPSYHPETMRSTAGTTSIGSNRKARQALGFDPRPLAEGYPDYIRWEMERMGLTPRA